MYIVFDLGGTNIRVAFSSDGITFGSPLIKTTPKVYEAGVVLLRRMALEVAGNKKIKAVAGGIAGPLDRDKTMLVRSPNLPDWVSRPLKQDLEKQLGCSVYLENDAALVGLGEATVGAGKGYGIVSYITVSTGVGGVRIENGEIEKNALGFEPGHIIIDPDKTMCPECEGNDLESLISGKSVERRFNKKPYEVTDKNFWSKMARYLAIGVHNIILLWSPDVVVIGGSMMKKVGISIEETQNEVKRILKIFPKSCPIMKAELGDFGGLHGALSYIRKKEGIVVKEEMEKTEKKEEKIKKKK